MAVGVDHSVPATEVTEAAKKCKHGGAETRRTNGEEQSARATAVARSIASMQSPWLRLSVLSRELRMLRDLTDAAPTASVAIPAAG
jgi:hypothetical protein